MTAREPSTAEVIADAGRVFCSNEAPHQPHKGCVYQLIDADVNRDHEEDER